MSIETFGGEESAESATEVLSILAESYKIDKNRSEQDWQKEVFKHAYSTYDGATSGPYRDKQITTGFKEYEKTGELPYFVRAAFRMKKASIQMERQRKELDEKNRREGQE